MINKYMYIFINFIYIMSLSIYTIYIDLQLMQLIHLSTCCTLTMFDKIAKSFRWNCAIWIHLGELLGNHQLSSSHLERT